LFTEKSAENKCGVADLNFKIVDFQRTPLVYPKNFKHCTEAGVLNTDERG
jgi:hypothetical protein